MNKVDEQMEELFGSFTGEGVCISLTRTAPINILFAITLVMNIIHETMKHYSCIKPFTNQHYGVASVLRVDGVYVDFFFQLIALLIFVVYFSDLRGKKIYNKVYSFQIVQKPTINFGTNDDLFRSFKGKIAMVSMM